MINRLIAWFRIPKGPYCYKFLSIDYEKGIMKTKPCPYYRAHHWEEYNVVNHCFDEEDTTERHVSYCRFLDEFDDVLLWDRCKICGIKEK